ncbi:MAG: hypothetical protein R3C68_02410 [Myxococcota bacterium]
MPFVIDIPQDLQAPARLSINLDTSEGQDHLELGLLPVDAPGPATLRLSPYHEALQEGQPEPRGHYASISIRRAVMLSRSKEPPSGANHPSLGSPLQTQVVATPPRISLHSNALGIFGTPTPRPSSRNIYILRSRRSPSQDSARASRFHRSTSLPDLLPRYTSR